MTGSFRDLPHFCGLMFLLPASEAWLGRVWQCSECRQCWEIIGMVGKGEIGIEITWHKVEPMPDMIDGETSHKIKVLDATSRRELRESS